MGVVWAIVDVRMTSWLTTIQSAMSDLVSGKSSYRRAARWTPALGTEASLCFDKGLSNAPGANNCFLNAAIQVPPNSLGVRSVCWLQTSVRVRVRVRNCFLRQVHRDTSSPHVQVAL